ncbi:probable cardiolipin synthase (CMP-forming) [Anopheles bellator]|uniref:probable cardiolipin synthase (CMP-forming) n=1 Tax=Anopheles bellator TaxID=139047 RepID=UPI00264761DE|nr:probable cardiolipin synthase (CMP-forming) [Anopheles bellator]
MMLNVAAHSLLAQSSSRFLMRLSRHYQHWALGCTVCFCRQESQYFSGRQLARFRGTAYRLHQPNVRGSIYDGNEPYFDLSPTCTDRWNAGSPFYRCYSSDPKKENHRYEIAVKSVERAELLQTVLLKNKRLLQEKRDVLVRDIRERKEKVKERVEEVIERENVATLPNLLCIGRIIASPYLGYQIVQGDFRFAMAILVVAGLTDLADGWIARQWPNQASRLGSFLDPMADKILVGVMVAAMSYIGHLPIWLTVMVLFRDVFLIGAGFVIRYISLPQPRTLSRYFDVTHATAQLAPTFISKLNTAVQLVMVAATLGAPIFSYIDHAYLHGLWYLTGFTTVAAAVSYLTNKDTYKILRKNP